VTSADQIKNVDVGVGDPSRSTNQTGVKLYNERLVLSLVREHGALSKGEISKMTGLSMQASSVISKQLENDGLLIKGEPVKGKVGQPSVPMSLNPEGAFSIGFKVGRRTAELVLMDMVGTIRRRLSSTYRYPEPEPLISFLKDGIEDIIDNMTRLQYGRVRGIGVAAPSEMWSWEDAVGAPHEIIEGWKTFDLEAEIDKVVMWPVHSYNDATAACAAELAFGHGREYRDFLYIFFATLVGGGVVLDGALYPGRRGYAGSIGSAPVPSLVPGEPSKPLIQCASVYLLERMIASEGEDPRVIWDKDYDWTQLGAVLDRWIEQTTDSLSLAIASAISVIDFHNVVIDGGFPPQVREQIVNKTREKVTNLRMEGVAPVEIVEGKVGGDARVLGAGCLPLLADFARDRDILFG
jgi:predicted NBD/HSP70 family sugar kinase